MTKLVLIVISLYQKTLSPDHGWFKARYPFGFCRFYPSCSQYAHEAIIHYGLLGGGVMAIRRIFRCNPWATSRVDSVYNQIKS